MPQAHRECTSASRRLGVHRPVSIEWSRHQDALGAAATIRCLILVAAACLAACPSAREAAAAGPTVVRVANGLNAPLFVTSAPGDPNQLFVVEQGSGGTADIKIMNLNNLSINPTPFLTISGIATGGEQGLLGLAFDPNYATNGQFYVDYTANGGSFGNGVTHITRYQVSSNPNVANPASATDVLTIDQPQTNHNGGWIGFSNRAGDSGNLYIAMGDGGNANDQGTGHVEPTGNAQDTFSLLGKMLRINVDTPGPASHPNYAIPANNPFANGASGAPRYGSMGCAIRFAIVSIHRPATCSWATSARIRAKRSTFKRPAIPAAARTTAGGSAKERSPRPPAASAGPRHQGPSIRFSITRIRRRARRSSAATCITAPACRACRACTCSATCWARKTA